jgi:hypothetical protein
LGPAPAFVTVTVTVSPATPAGFDAQYFAM